MQEKVYESCSGFDLQPVSRSQYERNMISCGSSCQHMCSRILGELETL